MGRLATTLAAALVVLTLAGSSVLFAPPAGAACAAGPLANECVSYGGHARQVMDVLYGTKTAPAPRPAVLFIHGGGWVGGDKASMNGLGRDIAPLGWVGFSMNYRLAGNHTDAAYVDQPADVESAVAWIRSNAVAYSIDPNRIALMGASAGGHLALLHGMKSSAQPVRAVVSFAGPTNLITVSLSPLALPIVPAYAGGCIVLLCPDRYFGGSPTSYVNAGDPATLLVHGLLDPLVLFEQALTMSTLLQLRGVHHELVPCVCGHDGGLYAHWGTTKAFLQQQLG